MTVRFGDELAGSEIYRQLYRTLAAWLSGTAQGGTDADFEELLTIADRHSLTAAVCMALEQTGALRRCPPGTAKLFQNAKTMAVGKSVLVAAERKKVLAFLEQRGIWYLPLEGMVMDGLWPAPGARQTGDSGILYDGRRRREVRAWMREQGYREKRPGSGVYLKPPVYGFEMRRELFGDDGKGGFSGACAAYYGDVRARALQGAGSGFGLHLSDEDFYVYLIARVYGQYSGGGAGLRTLLDGYLCRRARQGMDGAYIAEELEKLGLRDFEFVFRALGEKLFGPATVPALTPEEQQMLAGIESAGTAARPDREEDLPGVYRLRRASLRAARTVKGLLVRPFRKPASQMRPEKCAARAMQTYERFEGHTFDLEHPVLFTEKIVWYKLFYQHPDFIRIHDKYLFKDYIAEKLGPGYTAPLYGMWTDMRALERDWDSLPDSFCLKSNCSYASLCVRLVHDRKSENKKALFREVRRWLDPMNTAVNSSMRVYRDIEPCIMAEKLLPGEDGELRDYKIYCFDGKPYMIGAVADRFSGGESGAFSYYDLNWERLPATKKGHPGAAVPRPRQLDEMLRLADRLSEGFPFMRVDLYVSEGKVLVGELTPFSGNHFDQREFDLEVGKKFVLPVRSAI